MKVTLQVYGEKAFWFERAKRAGINKSELASYFFKVGGFLDFGSEVQDVMQRKINWLREHGHETQAQQVEWILQEAVRDSYYIGHPG